MRLARAKHSTIALDAGPASVAVCQLARSGGRLRIESEAVIEDSLRERPPEHQLAALSIERAKRLLQQAGFRGSSAGVALKPPEISFHTFAIPAAIQGGPRRELLSPLRLEAARQLQASPDEIEVDYWALPPGNRAGDNVMIVATRRAAVETWETFFSTPGLSLTAVDALPCALLRAAWAAASAGQPPGPDTLWGVLDIGFGSALLTLAIGSCCVYVRPLTVGGDGMTLALVDALEVDYKTAEVLKRQCSAPNAATPGTTGPGALTDVQQVVQGVLRTRIRGLAVEVERAFAYALESYPRVTLECLYLCGGGSRLPPLETGLRDALGINVHRFDPTAGLQMHARGDEAGLFAGCIGLAMGELLN